jgi:hypothetical protein
MKKLPVSLIFSLLLFIFSSHCALADFPTNGLVGYWKMDEASGSNVADTVYSNNGTATGTTVTSGLINNARNFDSSINDKITLPMVYSGTQNLTTSVWVNWNGTQRASLIVYGGNSSTDGYGLILGNSNCASSNQVNILLGNVSCAGAGSSFTLTPNQWTHLVMTRDSTTWKLYANGNLVGTGTTNPRVLSANWEIGGNAFNPGQNFPGLIDEVGIWNRALSADEVKALYNNGQGLPLPSDQITTQYYVSPTGSNTNPGTISQPFKTIDKARQVVRSINQTMTGNIIVNLRSGTYELNQTLLFDQNDSGNSSLFKVIYQSYPGEKAVISGGRKISGWIPAPEKSGVWKTNIGTGLQTRQLYVNGIRAIRARSDSSLNLSSATINSNINGFDFPNNPMATWQNQSQIEVVSTAIWKQFRCPIQNMTANSIAIQQPCFNNTQNHTNCHLCNMHQITWVENAFELLNSPGEWYLNSTNGYLYYYPRQNEDMNTAEVIVPVLEKLISVGGTSSTPAKNILFKDLIFAYATWLRPNTKEGYAHIQADYTITGIDPITGSYYASLYDVTPPDAYTKNPGNIEINYGQNIIFSRNYFLHLGAVGISLGHGTKNNMIVGNHFSDISAAAITLGEADNAKTTDNAEIVDGNQITNNYIHDVAAEYQGSVGLQAVYTQNTLISRNEINDVPYSGISIGWGWGRSDPTFAKNNLILNNFIHDHCKISVDCGGIYSLSSQPGNKIGENVITNGLFESGGMYLDDGSQYIKVESNVMFNNKTSAIFKGNDHNIHDNWWQDRGNISTSWGPTPDIWWFTSCTPALQPCNSRTINQNNHVITDLSQAPPAIISNAGLEPAYQDIKILPTFPPYNNSLPGDLNLDGHVDILDLHQLLSGFHNIFSYKTLVENFGN